VVQIRWDEEDKEGIFVSPLPYIDDGTNVVPEAVHKHMLCSRGLTILLDYGTKRWRSIRMAMTTTGVLPVHNAAGKLMTERR